MRHILLFILSLLFLIPPTFVLADEYGVLFRRKVHGQMGWFKDGDQQHNEKYQGEIKNGKPNGSGKLSHPKGGNYEGGFRDGLPHGLGTLDLLDGKTYDGEWIKGIKEGQGACTFADGSSYIGELKDGIIDGRGTFSYSNGNKYVGQWIAGKKDGQGTYTFFDGRKQSGQYKADEYWNIIMYDSVGNITRKWVNGKEIFDEKQNESIILRLWRGRMGWFDND